MSPVRRSLVSLLWVLALLAPVLPAAPQNAADAQEIVVRAYTFKYQRASEALPMIYPLLSPRGTVELQPGGNTLVIRDTAAAIRKLMPVLRAYDHRRAPLRLEIYVVRASRTAVSPQVQHSDLPEELTKRLRGLLAYDNFEKQAQAQLAGAEGQWVIYELGPEYKVSFRFGTLIGRPAGEALQLPDLPPRRGAAGVDAAAREPDALGSTTRRAWACASSESSPEALMLVLTLRDGEAAARRSRRTNEERKAMQFICRIGTPDGRVLEEIFSASDETALRSDLGKRGYHLFEVKRRGMAPKMGVPALLRGRPAGAHPGAGVPGLQPGAGGAAQGRPAAAPGARPDARADEARHLPLGADRGARQGQERHRPLRGVRRVRRPLPAPLPLVAQGGREERRPRAGHPPLHALHEAGARRPPAGVLGADLSGRAGRACRSS